MARSGSTLLLEMLTVPVTFGDAPTSPKGKFVLFEPCHIGDRAYGKAFDFAEKGLDVPSAADFPERDLRWCGEVVRGLAACDFSGVQRLAAWGSALSQGLPRPYAPWSAGLGCWRAGLVAFKTAFPFPGVRGWVLPRLEEAPGLRAVLNVRDPRAVYASQKRLFGKSRALGDICQYYATLNGTSHPRLLVVRFEDMVRTPYATMERLYGFLGLGFGEPQRAWIADRFWTGLRQSEVADCAKGGRVPPSYSTCRRDVEEVVGRWRRELGPGDLEAWSSPACTAVSRMFSY